MTWKFQRAMGSLWYDEITVFLAFVANLSLKMIFQFDNFRVDFKNLIVFALAIWEKTKP